MPGQLDLNFSNVSSGGALPAGRYTVIVADCQQEASKSSGNPMLAWNLTVMQGEHSGRRLFYYSALQQQALWSLQRDLRALGVEADGEINLDLDMLVGREVGVIVEEGEYQGRPQARVMQMIPADEVPAFAADAGPEW